MWSSLTLSRPAKNSARKDVTAGHTSDRVNEIANKKLARAATFCYDSHYKDRKTKKNWLSNFPNLRKKFTKMKIKEKPQVNMSVHEKEKVVINGAPNNVVHDDRNDREVIG